MEKMRPLHIIMPMAGEGSRFSNAGWATPKPLILLQDKPLFLHAIQSVVFDTVPMKYSFIVRKNHITENKIDAEIKKYLPNATIYAVEKTTRGAVETCLIAEKNIADDDGILVMDCDLEFRSESFENAILSELSKSTGHSAGGALVSFDSTDSRYSYAEIDKNMRVIRTAEKEAISNHALCGAYFFSTGETFLEAAHELVNKRMEKNEFYTSLLYNILLKKNKEVRLCKMEAYYSYGTPEELERYL